MQNIFLPTGASGYLIGPKGPVGSTKGVNLPFSWEKGNSPNNHSAHDGSIGNQEAIKETPLEGPKTIKS